MEITADQKVLVLQHQRKVLSAQVAVQNAQKQLEVVHNEYTQAVNKLVSDLKLDPSLHRLDLDNLTITEVEVPESAEV